MRILWVGPNFLHPTTKGGQIRTLGILRWLARRHEIHYAAYQDPAHPEAVELAREYAARAHAVRYAPPHKRSLGFAAQLAVGAFARTPVAVSRYDTPAMRRLVAELAREPLDRLVVDFLAMAPSCPRLDRSVLFQHNVETAIWRRLAENARRERRLYFRIQAWRMYHYERQVCRQAGRIVAVSAADAEAMRREFGADRISEIPTGVDLEYFARPERCERLADLVFIGSMDWQPNMDGVTDFVREILPLIRKRRPGCTFAIVGRTPPPEIAAMAGEGIQVTGTVADVRPYLWGAGVAVVPLRIGGGTRLKIYEAMAAGTPVVSTTIGAEGLEVHPPEDIRIADTPQEFADRCLELLDSEDESAHVAHRALDRVTANFSWERVARSFEDALNQAPPWAPEG
jgi:glycosyltransferase involved in cell wall biosynthesis